MGAMAWAVGRSPRARLVRGAAVLAVAGALWSPAWAGVPVLAFWNRSGSAPAGLYVYRHRPPARRGETVVLRDPPRFRLGWLLKRVEGVEGDTYCWDGAAGTQRLDGRPMPPPDPDAAAVGLAPWRGCVVLGPGELVGYGRSPDSYDSRYLGPVREADLWGVYAPVWVGG